MNLYLKLKEVRESRGFTQLELAEKIGTTYQMISDYEREKKTPSTVLLLSFILRSITGFLFLLGVNDTKRTTPKININGIIIPTYFLPVRLTLN